MNNIIADANRAARKATKDYVLEEIIDLQANRS